MKNLLRSAIREFLAEARTFGSDVSEGHITATHDFIVNNKSNLSGGMGWDTNIGPGTLSDFADFVSMIKSAAATDKSYPGEVPLTLFTVILIFDDADPGGAFTTLENIFGSLSDAVTGLGNITGMYESGKTRKLNEGLSSRLVVNLLGKTIDEAAAKAFAELTDEALEAELGAVLRKIAAENFDNDIKQAIAAMKLPSSPTDLVPVTIGGKSFSDARVAAIESLMESITVKLSPELAESLLGNASKQTASLAELAAQYEIRAAGGALTVADRKFKTKIIDSFNKRAYDTILDPNNLQKNVLRYTQGRNPVTRALTEPGRQAAKRGNPRLGRALSMGGEEVSPVTFWTNPTANKLATKLKYAAARAAAPGAGAAAYLGTYYGTGLLNQPSSSSDIGEYESATGEGVDLSEVTDMMEAAGVQSAAGRIARKLSIFDLTLTKWTSPKARASAESVKIKITGQLKLIEKSDIATDFTGVINTLQDIPSVSA